MIWLNIDRSRESTKNTRFYTLILVGVSPNFIEQVQLKGELLWEQKLSIIKMLSQWNKFSFNEIVKLSEFYLLNPKIVS